MRRTISLAMTILSLLGGACDFTPVCPPNTQYDNGIRRCRVLDGGTPRPDPDPIDAFVPEEDAGADEDAGGDLDGGASDDAGDLDAASDAGADGDAAGRG